MIERRQARAVVCVALLIAACGGQRTAPARTPPAEAARRTQSSSRPEELHGTQGPSSARQAEADVAAALAEAARIRELPPKGPVRSVLISRGEMSKKVEESILREVPEDVIAAEGDMLIALGVVPPTFDYVKTTVDLMTAELAGYYEPADKTMYLAADLGREEERATLAHELVHALQDQHYELGPILDYRPDASDLQSAVHDLAEGDAMSAMLDQLLESQGKKATDLPESLIAVQARAAAQFSGAVKNVPDILKRSLIAPYIDGLAFVHFLRRRGGWAEVDRAWQRLPESTEQIIHPEKFLSHERPLSIAVPEPPPGSKMALSFHDVLGEESLGILFQEWLPRKPAAAAAEHWGGDRVAVFRDGPRVAVAVHVRYDTEEAASLGFSAARAGVQPSSDPSVAKGKSVACVERPDRGPFLAAHARRDVVLVAGPFLVGHDARSSSASDCRAAAVWAALLLSQQ